MSNQPVLSKTVAPAREGHSNQLTFLFPLRNESGRASQILEYLHSFLTRAKNAVEVIIIDRNSDDNTVEIFEKNSLFSELREKGRIRLLKSEKGTRVADALQAGLKASNSEFIATLNSDLQVNLGSFNAWFTQHKKNFSENTVFTGLAQVPVQGGKEPEIKSSGVYNFFAKILTSISVKGTDSGFFLMSQNVARGFFADLKSKSARIAIEIPFKAKLKGYNLEEIPLPVKSAPEKTPGALSVFGEAFSTRWDWFVLTPARETFGKDTKIDLSLASGAHPVYRLIFFSLVMIAFFLLPSLSFDYGITWDEFEDNNYFKEVLNYFITFGADKSCLDTEKHLHGHLIYYGPFVNLLMGFANKFFSPFGEYETRHLIVSLFGFVGLVYTGLVARKAGTWRTAAIAFTFMLFTPFYFGHSMNNQKDIPFAAFYIASFYYIISFLRQLPKPKLSTVIFLCITMGITMSIRIGGLLVFAYLGLFSGLFLLYNVFKKKEGKFFGLLPGYLKNLLIVFLFAYGLGVIFWPYALQNPLKNPFEALANFEKFSLVHIYEIFEGNRTYMKEFPWYYIPKSMLITIPLFALSGLLITLVTLPRMAKKYDIKLIWMLLFILVFPIAYVIYKESAVYSSWRHLLFVYPGLVVLASMGWDSVISGVKKKGFRIAVVAVLAILVIKPAFWMVKNHPYQYMYYNELVGGINGAYGKYETDYWCQSPREAIEWLIANEPVTDKKTYVVSNNESHSMSYYAEKQTDSIVIGWARESEWGKQDWDYAIWTTRTLSKTQMENGYFPPKGTIHVIKVDDVPVAAIVKKENNYLSLGHRYTDTRQYDSAAYYFAKAAEYDPLNEEAWRGLGLAYLALGKLDDAKVMLEKSIVLCPENFYAHSYLGMMYMQTGNMNKAAEHLRSTIKYKINSSQAYAMLGDIHLRAQQYNDALKNYELNMQYGGQTPQVVNQIGKVYLGLNQLDNALNYFSHAIKLDPNFAEAHSNIAYVLDRKGDKENALKYQQKAIELMGGRN